MLIRGKKHTFAPADHLNPHTRMQLKRIILPTLFCTAALPTTAQTGIVNRLDSILEARQARTSARYDTAYIGKPEQKWTAKARLNMSGTGLSARGNINGQPFSSDLEAQPKNTVGASISYRGLSLGFALNPAKLFGKNKDYEFNLNAYANRVGADVVVTSAKTFSGTVEHGGTTCDVAAGSVSMASIQVNGYYAFNHRRFSFPAAFSQSQTQKRSCGSWLLGVSGVASRIENAGQGFAGTTDTRLSMLNIGVGAGYAYNFVIKRKWLVHLSALPQVVLYSRTRLFVDGERQRAPFKFPSFISVGRMAAVRSFGNKFAGVSAVTNLWYHGDSSRLRVGSFKWRIRMFYGFRF